MRFSYDLEANHATTILGITLRYARLKEGYSLRDMGELANMSHTLIANIERGNTTANQQTLKQLFSILNIDFRDDDDLVESFQIQYETIFNLMFQGELKQAQDAVRSIERHKTLYENSIVFVDFLILLFVYGVLSKDMTPYLRNYYDLSLRVLELLSDKQRQLMEFVIGVNHYNQGQFLTSYEHLTKAVHIGDERLDPLINLYRICDQVQMYRFMDAQELAEQTIPAFEANLNYRRAMEVRLQLAYSNLSLRNYDKAFQYINLVQEFGEKYQDDSLLETCLDRRLAIAMIQGNMETVDKLLQNSDYSTVTVTIATMLLAASKGDTKAVQTTYSNYVTSNALIPRVELYLKGLLLVFGGVPYTDEEYIDTFTKLIEIANKAIDQESLQFGYEQLIAFYQNRRMYKRAFELSEASRLVRSFGLVKQV